MDSLEPQLEETVEEAFIFPELPANYIVEPALIEDNRLGQLLLRNRVLSSEQLAAALDSQLEHPSRKLGEHLVELGLVTAEDIDAQLKLQLSELQLGQILLRTESINEADLDDALAEQERTGELLGSILVSQGHCAPEVLSWALSQQDE